MRGVRVRRSASSVPWSSQEGSLLFALLAILIIAAMVSALFVRTVSSQRTARFDRDFQEVVHHADAGVQQALFMLEADQFTDVEPGDPAQGPFTLDIDGGQAVWTIERVNSRIWEVTSKSDLNGVTRTVVASIEERRRFFASAFAQILAEFNNQNYADTYKSNDEPSLYGEDEPYWPRPGLLGIVGSNDEVVMGGSSSRVDGVQLWNFAEDETVESRCKRPGGGEHLPNTKIGLTSADAVGLENPDYDDDGVLTVCEPAAFVRPEDSLLGPYSSTFREERLFIPTNDDLLDFLADCEGPYPDFDNQTTGQHSHITDLEPVTDDPVQIAALEAEGFVVVPPQDRNGDGDSGDVGEEGYYCFDDMTFGQDTRVADPENPVMVYATGLVHVKGNGRKVNCENCPDTYGGTTAPPKADALQLYLVADGEAPTFKQAPDAQFGGTVYGPEAFCGGEGAGQAEVYGSLICYEINNVGGWKFHYDDALTVIGSGDFAVATWREETD